jgi:hypothetical protein
VDDLENLLNYEFESASQLIEDFWKSAEQYMENNSKRYLQTKKR